MPAARRSGVARITLLAPLMALCGLLGGCVGNTVYPPVEGVTAFEDPNSNDARMVMQQSLDWLITHYPPGPIDRPDFTTDYAINLPAGVRKSRYDIITHKLGPKARPITPETEALPIYHVSRIWIRGDAANVDILRPIAGWGSSKPVYQGVTTRMRGGVRQWRVTSHRVWSVGAMEVPQLNYAIDAPPELPADAVLDEPAPPEMQAPVSEPDTLWEPSPIIEDSTSRSIREVPTPPEQRNEGVRRTPSPDLPPGVLEVPNWRE